MLVHVETNLASPRDCVGRVVREQSECVSGRASGHILPAAISRNDADLEIPLRVPHSHDDAD